MKRDSGASVDERRTRTKGEIEAALRDFASRGYDIVIGHGAGYGEPALKVAKDFPDTRFVIPSGRVSGPNVTSLNFKMTDATYLVGILAAGVSKTGKAACVGGRKTPDVTETFNALCDGAEAAGAKLDVATAYIDSWDDKAAARRQTNALINRGADVVFHNADAAGVGVLDAVQDAVKAGRNVTAFGCNANQNDLVTGPDVVLASAVMDLGKALNAVAEEVRNGRFQGTVRSLGMKDGFVSLAINPEMESRIPKATLKKVHDAERAIREGYLTVKPRL
jgi:basic membrane lipoprotein Med (substrate-binding protein (PBP1-ABC) superfamily)